MRPIVKLFAIVLIAYGIAGTGAILHAADAGSSAVASEAAAPAEAATPAASAPEATPAPVAAQPDPFSAAIAAAKQGRWLVVFGVVLVGVVALIRRKQGWLVAKVAWLRSDRGGAVLVLFLGFLAEVATSLAANNTAPPGTVAALSAAVAAGGRAILKGLFTSSKPAGA